MVHYMKKDLNFYTRFILLDFPQHIFFEILFDTKMTRKENHLFLSLILVWFDEFSSVLYFFLCIKYIGCYMRFILFMLKILCFLCCFMFFQNNVTVGRVKFSEKCSHPNKYSEEEKKHVKCKINQN